MTVMKYLLTTRGFQPRTSVYRAAYIFSIVIFILIFFFFFLWEEACIATEWNIVSTQSLVTTTDLRGYFPTESSSWDCASGWSSPLQSSEKCKGSIPVCQPLDWYSMFLSLCVVSSTAQCRRCVDTALPLSSYLFGMANVMHLQRDQLLRAEGVFLFQCFKTGFIACEQCCSVGFGEWLALKTRRGSTSWGTALPPCP